MGSKSNIAVAILEKLPFLRVKKNISQFDGSNNIFADCIVILQICKNYQYPKYNFGRIIPNKMRCSNTFFWFTEENCPKIEAKF